MKIRFAGSSTKTFRGGHDDGITIFSFLYRFTQEKPLDFRIFETKFFDFFIIDQFTMPSIGRKSFAD